MRLGFRCSCIYVLKWATKTTLLSGPIVSCLLIFIYFIYVAALGLSCRAWDLFCDVWALVAACKLSLNFLTRGQTHILCIGRQILNQWTTRQVSQTFVSLLRAGSSSFLVLGRWLRQQKHCIWLSVAAEGVLHLDLPCKRTCHSATRSTFSQEPPVVTSSGSVHFLVCYQSIPGHARGMRAWSPLPTA